MHEERRKIIHIDRDAFYASVEISDNPFLKNSAVAVGGSARKRGVICTCNYKARSLGVRSAMPTIRALKLCPDLILLPVDMPKYQSVSNEIRKILFDYTSIVEPVSLDEAYLDVSDFSGSATWIGQDIRQKIKDKLSLTVSVGIASNKFLAKLASEHNKPDGLFVIEPQQTLSFISHLPVSEINGVGQVTRQKLKDMKIHTFFDLQKASLPELTRRFGVWGKNSMTFPLARMTDLLNLIVLENPSA
jgi:DNA polymerase IV